MTNSLFGKRGLNSLTEESYEVKEIISSISELDRKKIEDESYSRGLLHGMLEILMLVIIVMIIEGGGHNGCPQKS